MKVRLNTGMPPSLMRGEKQLKNTQNTSFSVKVNTNSRDHMTLCLSGKERMWEEENKDRKGESATTIGVLKLVRNTVRGKDGAEEKTEHNYKHPLAVQHE